MPSISSTPIPSTFVITVATTERAPTFLFRLRFPNVCVGFVRSHLMSLQLGVSLTFRLSDGTTGSYALFSSFHTEKRMHQKSDNHSAVLPRPESPLPLRLLTLYDSAQFRTEVTSEPSVNVSSCFFLSLLNLTRTPVFQGHTSRDKPRALRLQHIRLTTCDSRCSRLKIAKDGREK